MKPFSKHRKNKINGLSYIKPQQLKVNYHDLANSRHPETYGTLNLYKTTLS